MTSLLQFLRDLSIDPLKMSAFVKDPKAAMDASGLDENSRRVLYSGSSAAMWDLLHGRPVADPKDARLPAAFGADKRGSLIVLGTGIRSVGQLTLAAISWLKESSVVYYLVADPVAEEVIKHLNPNGAVSLKGKYGEGSQSDGKL